MKTYICKLPVELSRKDFDRITKLFKVNFDDESPEMEALINELDARPNTNSATFWWEFEDVSTIQLDIESNDEYYMDNAILSSETNEFEDDYFFEGIYSFSEEMKYCDGENMYICKVKIKENEDKKVDDLAVCMTAREIGQYVLEAKDDENIYIALNSADGSEIAYHQALNCSCWYIGFKRHVEETDSYVFFIDYAGGGNPAVLALEPNDDVYNEEALIDFFETWLKDTVEQMGQGADVNRKGERVAYVELSNR